MNNIEDKIEKIIHDLNGLIVKNKNYNEVYFDLNTNLGIKHLNFYYVFDKSGTLKLIHRYYDVLISQAITPKEIFELSRLPTVDGLKTVIVDYIRRCLKYDFGRNTLLK